MSQTLAGGGGLRYAVHSRGGEVHVELARGEHLQDGARGAMRLEPGRPGVRGGAIRHKMRDEAH